MSEDQPQPYKAKKISVIAKGADVLVREYELGPGEFVPWHHHTAVTDHFYCLEGTVLIETRAPAARRELSPGESVTVTPPTAHHVSGASGSPCRFLLIQGVGRYDFVKEE
ncbi:MAG: cupin domain-containing protein [Burkholderiales bacterium]|nr:cupin domain-containing protein [Burkholderiales bacterium]MCJ7839131.1 cupin domain-containing protein [Burkholderiales bacterium]